MLPREDESHDRLHKIRPVISYLLNRFQMVPYEACLSVDEQMCDTKAKNYMRQYMPAKPHKWGYKLFVLSGISGYSYNFEVYTGQENKINNNEKDLGACANVVVRLGESLCSMGIRQISQRGRKSDIDKQLENKRQIQNSIPSKDVRTDHYSHWPEWKEKRNR
ncbi:hypothetical protein ILUMI_12617, partial [Ignelater luminosus]